MGVSITTYQPCVVMLKIGAYEGEPKCLLMIADRTTKVHHHCLSQAKVARQEQSVTKVQRY